MTVYDFKELMFRPSPTPKSTPKPHSGRKTRGRINWEQDLETFRCMSEGERNSTLVNLALRGRSLEISGNFSDGETIDLLRDATLANSYAQEEGWSRVDLQISYMRDIADREHSSLSAQGNEGGAGKPFYSSLVPPSSCTPYRVQRFIDDVHGSSLPPTAKQQLITAAYIQSQHPEWTHLVMSHRATAAASNINLKRIGPNWKRAEKLGFIGYSPGVDYETAKITGVDSRSSEITLNLDIYPDEPVENPQVNLNDFKNQASNFQGYIKFRHREMKKERIAHLQGKDVSTAETSQPSSESLEEYKERPKVKMRIVQFQKIRRIRRVEHDKTDKSIRDPVSVL